MSRPITLKISLKGSQPQSSPVTPFYGLNSELPQPSEIFSGIDLISYNNLNSFYNRFCVHKTIKDDLASFLPNICGAAHTNTKYKQECSLRELIEKPPIMGSIKTLTADQIAGFKLAPGQVSINSRLFDLTEGLNATQLNPPESIREDGGKRYKRSLDDFEEIERRVKKHKMDEREKEKKKKKKKDKEKRKKNEGGKKSHRKEGNGD